MANKTLFTSAALKPTPTDTVNKAGGAAYKLSDKHALAQMVATGTFGDTFYANAETQLAEILALVQKCNSGFIARLAVWGREKGYMKDAPALCAAVLTTRGEEGRKLLGKIFHRVIDNGRMVRNFSQIIRSGTVGRKSFGHDPKRLIREWFDKKSDHALFNASVGNAPSLADLIKMVHPKPKTEARDALFAYIIGSEKKLAEKQANLPKIVKDFEAFKKGETTEVPSVNFQMLTGLSSLTPAVWRKIAETAGWQWTRMNLRTMARHGLFADNDFVKVIADRLRNPELVRESKCFPYQLLMAFNMVSTDSTVPPAIGLALQDAMEIATENVPAIAGKVWVFPDVSGSMGCAITGNRKGATSTVRCVDVAALIAATILRKNPEAEVIPIDTRLHTSLKLNPRDSVMTNAKKLASCGGGGTHLGLAMDHIKNEKGDLVIFVSDNESWVDRGYGFYDNRGTQIHTNWKTFKKHNKNARLVCLDLNAGSTTQAPDKNENTMNIGGFSDQVFSVISDFAAGMTPENWVGEIEKIDLDAVTTAVES